jgi:hypothetical protein
MMITQLRILYGRVAALKKAMKRAKNPEFKDLWERKLKELIANERVARNEK